MSKSNSKSRSCSLDPLTNSIDSIRNLKIWVDLNNQFLPSVIEHKSKRDKQFSNLLEQLWGTENVLCHLCSSTLESHWPLLRELDCVVGRAVSLVTEVCFKSKPSIGSRENDAGEHYLELFLDLRWWTWMVIYEVNDKYLRTACHGERFFVTPKGVLDPASSKLLWFMHKLHLWWSRSDGYVRHLPSYGIEVFLQETKGPSSLFLWLKTEYWKPMDKSGTTRDICSASAETFLIEGKALVRMLDARKPSWVGDDLKVDLTQAVLGMSNSGLVIKCEDSGTKYALKRVPNLNQKQPVTARLCHPHIVQLMSYWRENGFLFLMMEFMEGNLKHLITIRSGTGKSPFAMDVALDILLQIAKAMLYLHDLGLTHPHLKSSDVLYRKTAAGSKLDKNDTRHFVKLGDFQFYPKKDFESMVKRNLYQFGLICLEVLSKEPLHWEFEDRVMGMSQEPKLRFTKIESSYGSAMPETLTQCIRTCLDGSKNFSDVVALLLLAQLQALMRATKESSPRYLDSKQTMLAEHQDIQPPPGSSSRFNMTTEAEIWEGPSVEIPIEQPKAHWSDLSDSEDEIDRFGVRLSDLTDEFDSDEEEEEVKESNVEVFKSLQMHATWGRFFRTFGDGGIHDVGEMVIGDKYAEVKQAELYHVRVIGEDQEVPSYDDPDFGSYGTEEFKSYGQERQSLWVLKVFKKGTFLRYLQKQWPQGMLRDHVERVELGKSGKSPPPKNICDVYCGTLLPNGRFAFLVMRAPADLRTLIDLGMKSRMNPDSGPFSKADAESIMYCVARGMRSLHNLDIVHRDLKASNVLCNQVSDNKKMGYKYDFYVADFECSLGVVGTGFFRAPEILNALKHRVVSERPDLFTKAVDVYSYGMLCYEVLTGKFPFEDHPLNDYDLILNGQRPELPHRVEEWTQHLLRMCWHPDPEARPTFIMIMDVLEIHSKDCRDLSRGEIVEKSAGEGALEKSAAKGEE